NKARLRKDWFSSVYAFFKPEVTIKYEAGKRGHQFHCAKATCTTKLMRWLDKSDSRLTGNLHKHVRNC
ncbi:hypothetical protein JOM56_013038, partial [Amanita muscaria]